MYAYILSHPPNRHRGKSWRRNVVRFTHLCCSAGIIVIVFPFFVCALTSPGWQEAWQATRTPAFDSGGSGLPSGYEQHRGEGETLVGENNRRASSGMFDAR